MKMIDKARGKKEPPNIISDLNGNIIYVNNEASSKLYPVKTGDSVSKYVSLDYIKKLSMLDNRIDVVSPDNCKFKKMVIRTVGKGVTKTIELTFFHTDTVDTTEIMDDKKLFATFSEIMGTDIKEKVRLDEFIYRIVDCMHANLRFAYRKFNVIESGEIPILYTNFSHLSAIAIGTIIALNEIEYKNPIEISIIHFLGQYQLKILVPKNTFFSTGGLCEVCELYPRIAMRLMYIASLCENDGIKFDIEVKPNCVFATFVINNMINETGKFSQSIFGTDQVTYISHIIDLFTPNDTTKEEIE